MSHSRACEDDAECRIHCGPETACRRYYELYTKLFDKRDWELYKYKLFVQRFDERACPKNGQTATGCRVKVTFTEEIPEDAAPLDPMAIINWYESYRYREGQMDLEKAWGGIYGLFAAEREFYLRGYEATRRINDALITGLLTSKELKKELNLPAVSLLPQPEALARLKIRDLIYAYLGGDAVKRLATKNEILAYLERARHPVITSAGELELKPDYRVALRDYFGAGEVEAIRQRARATGSLDTSRKQFATALKQSNRRLEEEISKLLNNAENGAPPAAPQHTFLVPKAEATPRSSQ